MCQEIDGLTLVLSFIKAGGAPLAHHIKRYDLGVFVDCLQSCTIVLNPLMSYRCQELKIIWMPEQQAAQLCCQGHDGDNGVAYFMT